MEGVRNPLDAGEAVGSPKQRAAEEVGLQGLRLLQACTQRLAARAVQQGGVGSAPRQAQAAAAALLQQQLQGQGYNEAGRVTEQGRVQQQQGDVLGGQEGGRGDAIERDREAAESLGESVCVCVCVRVCVRACVCVCACA